MKSHKTSSSTRFSPILSPLPLPQHLDVQPPTYHKIPPVFRPPSTRRQNIPLLSIAVPTYYSYYRVEYYLHLLRSLPEDLRNNLHLMQIRKRFDHLSALPQSISVIFHLYSLVVLYWQNSLPNRHLYSILYLNSYFSKSHNFYYHDLSCIFPVLF